MFDILLEKLKSILTSRLMPITIIFIAFFVVLVSRVFTIQIVEGETYSGELSLKYVKTREVKSTRGNIYDRNGVLLAYNKLTYSVILENSSKLETNDEKNTMLFNLIKVLERHGNEIECEFGISIDKNGKLYFNVEENAELRFKKNAYGLRSVNDLSEEQKKATADEVFAFLRHGDKRTSMFNISDDYTLEEALKIMTLRYAMYTNYPSYNQIVIATDVNEETVAAVYENIVDLPGVEIKQDSKRVYNDSLYNSQILGYTGLISESELEALKDEPYDYNSSDVVGKVGIEQEFETYLAGTKGTETISVNENNKFLKVLNKDEPVAGNDVYLTIDSNMQKAIYKIIEKHLAGILLSKINNSTDAGTRGTSTKDIKIPIYDVYYALINNNVVNIDQLDDKDASDLEKSIYHKFQNRQEEVLAQLDTLLKYNNTTVNSATSEEMQGYLSYVFSVLTNKSNDNSLFTSNFDTDDSTYQDYKNDKISLSKFLQYAISKNWIDLTKLNVGDEYLSTEELYQKIKTHIKNMLTNDSTFHKKIYKDLVYSYNLSGTEICLLLFDQGVLKYNKEDVTKLRTGVVSAYTFITDKIRNIEITPAQLALEPCSASVVVTDIKTGDVRAIVSYPSYDNNKFANKIDTEYYNKLYNDLSLPMNNRATSQRTAPGSTFKMVTSAAGLEEGKIFPGSTIYDQVTFTNIKPSPHCWSTTSHGDVDVTTALEVSCNYFFFEVGWRLGTDSSGIFRDKLGLKKIAKYASLFGLDRKSGIELVETAPIVSNSDTVRSAIGQSDNSYTPVQIARYLTTIANSGTCFDLTLVNKIVNKDGKVIVNNKAKSTQVNLKDSTWDLIHEGMYKVANGSRSSSSSYFKNYPYQIAGKTGTAQVSTNHASHALFVSYAPYKDPEIAMTVVIPNGYASSNAVELARDVYSYYFELDGRENLTNGKAKEPDAGSTTSFTD